MKLKTMTRLAPATFVASTLDMEKRTIDLAFSSETPVERFFGEEVLSHDGGAARLGRFNDGANVLFNHNIDDVVGVIEKGTARIDQDKVGRATVRFAKNARGEEMMALVADNIITKTSFRYQIHKVEERKEGYLVRDWEPLEASFVTVPADASVGVGRAASDEELEVEVVRAVSEPAVRDANTHAGQPAEPKGTAMSEVTTAPAGNPAETKQPSIGALEAEKQRRTAIEALCKSNKIDARVQARWIEDGTELHEVAGELLTVMEERGKTAPTTASNLGLTSRDTQRYSLFKAIRAMHFGAKNPQLVRDAAYEIECSTQVAKQLGRGDSTNLFVPGEVLQRKFGAEAARAMATTPGSKGGYMVNVENMGFIDILRNRSVVMNMGARVISGLQGNVMFPRQTGKGTVTWQAGEHVSVTAADQALGQLSMTPKTAIAITDVSEQLLRQASPSAEAFIMADLASCIAIDGVDLAALIGAGGAEPLGIKNTTGITSGQSASTFSYTKALAFPVAAGAVNAIRGNPGWVTNIAGAAIAMQKQRFTSTDTPLWEGNLLDGTLVGFKAMSSEQIPSGNLIFGSWDEVVIGEWGVLELATDTGGTRFNTATVGIRAMWMVDVMIRYPQAFVVSTDLSA